MEDEQRTEIGPAIVSLNVGGTLYQISRTLLEEQHSETMLARLVSETWQQDPHKTIFIERNGFRFQFLLDYLRDGSVDLPMSVSRTAFLKDLEYFGIVYDEAHIRGTGTMAEAVLLGAKEQQKITEKAFYYSLANKIIAEYCRLPSESSFFAIAHDEVMKALGAYRTVKPENLKILG